MKYKDYFRRRGSARSIGLVPERQSRHVADPKRKLSDLDARAPKWIALEPVYAMDGDIADGEVSTTDWR